MSVYSTFYRPLFATSVGLLIAIVCAGCARDGRQFEGQWQSRNATLVITRNGEAFVVTCKNPNGLLNGNFAGTLTDAGLKVNAGLAGEQIIVHAQGSDSLSFAGETFARLSGASADGAQIWVAESGLIWTLKDNGRKVNNTTAIAYCSGLHLGGWSDWRLPSIEELRSVYDPAMHAGQEPRPDGPPAIRPPLSITRPRWFGNKQSVVWSGSTDESTVGRMSLGRFTDVLNFANGAQFGVGAADESQLASVFCVRDTDAK